MCASQSLAPQVIDATLRQLPTFTRVKFSTRANGDRPPLEATYRGPAAEGRFWFTTHLEWFLDPSEITYLEVVDA